MTDRHDPQSRERAVRPAAAGIGWARDARRPRLRQYRLRCQHFQNFHCQSCHGRHVTLQCSPEQRDCPASHGVMPSLRRRQLRAVGCPAHWSSGRPVGDRTSGAGRLAAATGAAATPCRWLNANATESERRWLDLPIRTQRARMTRYPLQSEFARPPRRRQRDDDRHSHPHQYRPMVPRQCRSDTARVGVRMVETLRASARCGRVRRASQTLTPPRRKTRQSWWWTKQFARMRALLATVPIQRYSCLSRCQWVPMRAHPRTHARPSRSPRNAMSFGCRVAWQRPRHPPSPMQIRLPSDSCARW